MFNMFQALLLFLLISCFQYDETLSQEFRPSARILGGYPSREWVRYIVSIQEPQEEGQIHICGGSILRSNWIVTAAHCVYDQVGNDTPLLIQAGSNALDTATGDGVVYINVNNIIIHPNYEPQNDSTELHPYDIALLELEEELTLGPYIASIEVIGNGSLEEAISSKEDAYIFGWGATEISVIPRFLYALQVVLWTDEECTADIDKPDCHTFQPDIELCTGPDSDLLRDRFTGASFRDDGGPLVVRNKLAGVILHGQHPPSEGQCHESTIYEKITQFQDFIDEYVS